MGDVAALYCVLILIYLADCVLLGRRGCYFFRRSFNGSWCQLKTRSFPLFGNYALLVKGLFPWMGPVIVSEEFPLAGLVDFRFAGSQSFRRDGRAVLVGSETISKLESEARALTTASVMQRIQNCTAEHRQGLISEEVSKQFDSIAIGRRLSKCCLAAEPLRASCIVMFLLLFVFAPCTAVLWGLSRTWMPLLLAIFANSLLVTCLFFHTHRQIHPLLRGYRLITAATLFLSPPAAIRAEDWIFRDAFCGWHPLALAVTLCKDGHARSGVTRILRETLFASDRSDQWSTNSWHRNELACIRQLIADSETAFGQLLLPPIRESPRSACYCPRCLSQYIVGAKTCSDCEVDLVSF